MEKKSSIFTANDIDPRRESIVTHIRAMDARYPDLISAILEEVQRTVGPHEQLALQLNAQQSGGQESTEEQKRFVREQLLVKYVTADSRNSSRSWK